MSNYMSSEEAIEKLQKVQGVKYTDENLAIIKFVNGEVVLASAGSGKTSQLIAMICYRIMTGAIKDTSKLLVTTYSKGGREELEERLNSVLEQLDLGSRGIRVGKIEVRTLHSAYMALLKDVGSVGKVNEHRMKMIGDAMKACHVKYDDELLQKIDGLLSYQINNMLTDVALAKECAYDIADEVDIEKFKLIAANYRQAKTQLGVLDFDDMQMKVYSLLVSNANARELFRNKWQYFYIDEAQDMSKIQFQIQKMLMTDIDKAVFVGDDDQCLVAGTQVITPDGVMNIEEVTEGCKVLSGVGKGKTKFAVVDKVSRREVNEDIVVITTESGRVIRGTRNHVGFARLVPNENYHYVYLMFKRDVGFRIGVTSGLRAGNRRNIQNGIDMRLMQEKADKAWLVKKVDSKEEALYWESYYAYKYGIPMDRFLEYDEDTKKKSEWERSLRLNKELDTYKRGMDMLKQMGMYFDYPHRVPQAEGSRCKINYSMFSSSACSAKGIYKSELSVNTSNKEYLDVVSKYLSTTVRKKEDTGYEYMNCRLTTADVTAHESKMKQIIRECEEEAIYLDVSRNAKFNDNKYLFVPFGNMVEGMYVPVVVKDEVVEEEIVSIEKEHYEGYVYDLSVPDTRNFVADDIVVHNCIYEWRGADPSIIQNICGYYDIKSFVLSTNFRCAKKIVRHAYKTIRNNSNRTEKEMKPYEGNSEGNIYVEVCKNNLYTMSKKVYEEITYLLDNGLAEEKDIAILCRNNAHGVILNAMLSERYMAKVNEDTQFYKNKLAKEIDIAIKIANNTNSHIYGQELWKYVQYMSSKAAYMISTMMKENACSIKTAIKTVLWELFAINKTDNVRRLSSLSSKYKNLEYALKDEAIGSLSTFYDMLMEEDEALRAEKVINRMLAITCGFIYKTADKTRMICGIADYIIDIIHAEGLDGYERLMDRLKEQGEIKWDKMKNVAKDKMTISTMHGAKGKQWKYVFLVADDNIALPSFETIQKMASEGKPVKEISKYIEGERRLHYVAMTRAQETLYCYTIERGLSAFLAEAFEIIEKTDNMNGHIRELIKNGGYTLEQQEAIKAKLENYKNPRTSKME